MQMVDAIFLRSARQLTLKAIDNKGFTNSVKF